MMRALPDDKLAGHGRMLSPMLVIALVPHARLDRGRLVGRGSGSRFRFGSCVGHFLPHVGHEESAPSRGNLLDGRVWVAGHGVS